jgi:hypothetical protein
MGYTHVTGEEFSTKSESGVRIVKKMGWTNCAHPIKNNILSNFLFIFCQCSGYFRLAIPT